jgi:hypothetical protein
VRQTRKGNSSFLEIALVLVRLDQFGIRIVNANHSTLRGCSHFSAWRLPKQLLASRQRAKSRCAGRIFGGGISVERNRKKRAHRLFHVAMHLRERSYVGSKESERRVVRDTNSGVDVQDHKTV